jgi:uncharacterized protein YjiK
MPLPTNIDLSTYVLVARYDLPEPTRTTPPANSLLAQEVSAVTYHADTDTLFVVGDAGTSIVQVSKTGQLINSMTLATGSSPQGTEFYDPEGLTYIGNGQFVMTEERDRQVVKFTYVPDTILTRANSQTVDLGTFVQNTGLEGLTFDPQTGGFIFVNEISPEEIFQTNIDFAAGTATNGSATATTHTNLFNPALVGLSDFADVYAMSNIAGLNGQTDSSHILVLSQEEGKIVEVDRAGNVYSSLTITSNPGNPLSVPAQQHEGLTMDAEGNLYVVSENGGGNFDHPQLWVYAPSTVPNQAPTAVALTNQVNAIDENTSTTLRVKVADVVLTDDGIGTNNYSLSGADASFFEVSSNGLYIKAGTFLDYETKTSYAVTVNVDDPGVGVAPDASTTYNLSINNIVNENSARPVLYISEVAPWSSGNSPVGSDWFEVTNSGSTAIDITGWKMDDNSNSFASGATFNGVTSIGAGQSVIFIECTPAELAAKSASFIQTWFGANAPANLVIASYSGSGVGLSTASDAVNLYNASGVLQANVSFGQSPTGIYTTFNNAAGLNNAVISTPSVVGTNGAAKAVNDPAEIGSPGTVGKLFISEIAPWSSGNSPVALRADWFEVTNTTAFAVDITGWKIDDNSGSPAAAVPLNGVTSLAAGQSVIFIECTAAELPAKSAAFIQTWFGGVAPANLVIGSYSGAGVGLGAGGDAVNLYDASNVLQASVSFGASPTGPYSTFDNSQGLNGVAVTLLSSSGANGAFVAAGDPAEIGSPGFIAPVVVNGTSANDSLVGTPGNDTLDGKDGNDTIDGKAGIDILIGGLGSDTLTGGAGNDTLAIGVRAALDLDTLSGGVGRDTIDLSSLTSAIWLDLNPSAGPQVWTSGANTATGGTATTQVANVDTVENIIGTSGSDTILGNDLDNAYRYNGNTVGTADVFQGRGGSDTIDVSSLSSVWVDLSRPSYTGNIFTNGSNVSLAYNSNTLVANLGGVENIVGTSGSDLVYGDGADNTFVSNGVANVGGAQALAVDYFSGGAGSDTIDLSSLNYTGAIWVDLTYAEQQVWLANGITSAYSYNANNYIATLVDVENVVGTSGTDQFYGDGANNTYFYNGKATGTTETVDGRGGADTFDGSRSDTSFWIDLALTSMEVWSVGSTAASTGANANTMIADLTSIENITGSAYADVIYGEAGNNRIEGGFGNDTLVGRAGNDTFVFEADAMGLGISQDRIIDFTVGVDVIELNGYGAAFDTLAEILAVSVDRASGVSIEFSATDTIIFSNVTRSQFTMGDFVFV